MTAAPTKAIEILRNPGGAHAETLIAACLEAAAAIELAYGLLWFCPSDRNTVNGERIYQARQALLATLDRDARLRGLKAVQDLTASPGKMH